MRNNQYRYSSLFSQPKRPKPPRKKWRIRYVIWAAIKRTCMAIGAIVLFSAILGTLLSFSAMNDVKAPTLPDEMVLYMPLKQGLIEHADMSNPYGFGDRILTIREVVNALDKAAMDKRVKGFVMTLDGGGLSLAHIEELRVAISRFRATDKFAYIYAPSYRSFGSYYLASAFEQIWLQPMGVISMPGIHADIPYAREVLDKIGAEPQFFARKEYKSLFESFTDKEMSETSREMMTALINDIGATLTGGAAAARGVDEKIMLALVDQGLFTDEEALAAGLIDKLDYGDVINAHIKEKVKGDPESDEDIFATVGSYINHTRQEGKFSPAAGAGKKPKVALVYAVGQIVQHDETGSVLSAANNLVKTIRKAADDDDVQVIVVRVDSPGGDPTASETIRRAIVKAKEKGKKVVVSMGNNAASGGYWIATDADYIFALPTTFTGSIGVTGGKFSLQSMWQKIGVNWDGVQWGDNAGLWSLNQPYLPSETERMNALMDNIYDGFIARVAAGRAMTPEQVDRIARGRVWTGAQAVDLGLADELGGLDKTLDYAAGLTGVSGRHEINVVVMPEPKTPFEKVLELLQTQAAIGQFFKTHADVFVAFADMLDALKLSMTSPYSGVRIQAQ